MSGLFTAVGFGSFEALKVLLGVSAEAPPPTYADHTVATASNSAGAPAGARREGEVQRRR